MKKILFFVVMRMTSVFALEKQELMPLIGSVATTTGNAYLEVRNQIVNCGTNLIPVLGTIAIDETLPWQQRLVARICYERIERKNDIEKLLATDWYSHPKFNPEWNEYLSGPEIRMRDMVIADLKDAGLWYYYLEVEWKMTGETAKLKRDNSRWVSWCTFAVKDSPEERIWFLRICADLMALTPPPPRWDKWLFPVLVREEKPDMVFVLEHRAPPPVPEEPPFRFGTNIVKRVNQP